MKKWQTTVSQPIDKLTKLVAIITVISKGIKLEQNLNPINIRRACAKLMLHKQYDILNMV